MDKNFSLLIKPTSADCNLRCGYCFYLEKSALYPKTEVHRMNEATLHAMISKYMALGVEQSVFGWQGGEPLLMGVDYFRKVVDMQSSLGKKGQKVSNSVQTNGILINEEWVTLFNEYAFLIGLSLDGPDYIHNANRFSINKSPVFSKVMSSLELLQKRKVLFNILTVISQANVSKAKEVYGFIKRIGVNYHQYIPAVRSPNSAKTTETFSVTGEEYGRFLIDLFNEWYPSDVNKVSIRFFDAIVNKLVTGAAQYCEMGESCSDYFVIEHNGDTYPCDFFVEKELKLGNINQHSFLELRNSEKYRRFARLKSINVSECHNCPYLFLCNGGCIRHRDYGAATNKKTTSLCYGLKLFYKETLGHFREIAASVKERYTS